MSNRTQEVFSFIRQLIVFVIIVSLIRGSIVEPYKIPSSSMVPTLQVGDLIIVSKFTYSFRLPFFPKSIYQYDQPKRGDVVVFTREDDPLSDEDESSINVVKRVVGLPGETIEVVGTSVLINGKELTEDYAIWLDGGIQPFGPLKIPENSVLLLGDNRDNSRDSRFWPNPFLEISRIKGKAKIVIFNFQSPSRIGTIIR